MNEYEDAQKKYRKACAAFIEEASDAVAFELITAENPEAEREATMQLAQALALLADQYDSLGMGSLSGSYIIDDLAARALAAFKALGHDINLDEI